jgi:hypothetical protein
VLPYVVIIVAVAAAVFGWMLYRRHERLAHETTGQVPPPPGTGQ